jgi:hypothetical protein
LANPSSSGGANALSLAEAQGAVLLKHPLDVSKLEDVRRAPAWRPLFPQELEAIRSSTHWANKAILLESETYWCKPTFTQREPAA